LGLYKKNISYLGHNSLCRHKHEKNDKAGQKSEINNFHEQINNRDDLQRSYDEIGQIEKDLIEASRVVRQQVQHATGHFRVERTRREPKRFTVDKARTSNAQSHAVALTIYRVRMMHKPNNKHGQANGRPIDESQIEIDFTIEILEQLGR